jgi:hypothetical protein
MQGAAFPDDQPVHRHCHTPHLGWIIGCNHPSLAESHLCQFRIDPNGGIFLRNQLDNLLSDSSSKLEHYSHAS